MTVHDPSEAHAGGSCHPWQGVSPTCVVFVRTHSRGRSPSHVGPPPGRKRSAPPHRPKRHRHGRSGPSPMPNRPSGQETHSPTAWMPCNLTLAP